MKAIKAIKAVYIKGVHGYDFGYHKIAEVIGVRIIETNIDERVCFHVRYDDGQEDFVSLESVKDGQYIFVHKDGTKLTR